MRRVLSGCGRILNGLRLTVVNGVFLVLLLVVLSVLLADRTPQVPDGGALVLAPSGVLVDQASYIDPLLRWLQADQRPPETLLRDLIEAVDRATADPRIAMLVIQPDGLMHGGLSKLQELAPAIARFRDTGRPVVALGDSFTQDQYWLAAQADEVLMHPMGGVLLQGYGVYRNYFREALDKLDVDIHVFRVGEYKSAVEPLLRNDMSAADREANLEWLNALWQQYSAEVIQRRGLTAEQFGDYVNAPDRHLEASAGDAAQAALTAGLVDAVMSREVMNTRIAAQVGRDDNGGFRGIDFRDYLRATVPTQPAGLPAVGLVVASGLILDGYHPPGVTGGDTLAELIREARRDPDIGALVLRVDSEGGSAFASEVIREELQAFKASGRPLVVSMGSLAASGGYWIAVDADEIWATPATLTGSIGIFGAVPGLDRALSRLGIHTDGVGTGALAGQFRLDVPLSDQAGRVLQLSVEDGYRRFLERVARGRGLPLEQVEGVAQGRVWSGTDAQGIGLVDRIGGLGEALHSAAELAGLSAYRVQVIEPGLSPRDLLLQQLFEARALASRGGSHGADPLVQRAGNPVTGLHWLARLGEDWRRLLFPGDPRALYLYCVECSRP